MRKKNRKFDMSLRINFTEPVLTINRVAFGQGDRFVYVICAEKKLRYPWGKSRIGYIGTTKRGARRIASSAVWKGEHLLLGYGIKHLNVRIIRCRGRRAVETWRKLERALLLKFRERYGKIPLANKAGGRMSWDDEHKYFKSSRLEDILRQLS